MNIEDINKISSSPIFAGIDRNELLRVMKSSCVEEFKVGQYIFQYGQFGDKCGFVLSGVIRVEVPNKISKAKNYNKLLLNGDFFGEVAVLSGYPRIANVIGFKQPLRIVFIPGNAIIDLIDRYLSFREIVNSLYKERILYYSICNLSLFYSLDEKNIKELVDNATIHTFKKDKIIFRQGDKADGLYIIRYGVVKIVEKTKNGNNKVLAILKEGQYFGIVALLCKGATRIATVVACDRTEIIRIDSGAIYRTLDANPNLKENLETVIEHRKVRNCRVCTDNYLQKTFESVIDTGVIQSSSIILIDTTKCIHCDNCEKACAALHENQSRLIRKGFKLNNFLLIPTSCRLCDDPACMMECPTNSISRDFTGEIYHKESCIGCGKCAENCPYDNITICTLSNKDKVKQSCKLISTLKGFFKKVRIVAKHKNEITAKQKSIKNYKKTQNVYKKAVTCDKCKGFPFYSCTYNCPTGAARRVDPVEFFTEITTIG